MSAHGPGSPGPGSPTPGDSGSARPVPAPREVDRLHAALVALQAELPALVDDVEDAAAGD